MKTPRWLNQSRNVSNPRIASAITLVSVAAAMAFVSVDPACPFLMGKANAKNITPGSHTMLPGAHRLASPETVAGIGGPQYGIFNCQLGAPFANPPGSQCYDPFQMRHAYQIDSLISSGF